MDPRTGKRRITETMDSKAYASDTDGMLITRKRTTVERDLSLRKDAAHDTVSSLPTTSAIAQVKEYMPRLLENALFCGHLVTDLDSIAGAMGAAELYGGIAARASEVNSETKFALELWGVQKPEPIEELLVKYPDAGVCLVDHQQTSQLNPSIDVSRSECSNS